ncbi:MAG TPA: Hsp20/alpha crystallin family protein [Desulfobacteraceae bacterium]|nr:Hsp20/alpha crystallin family protein [Desulfobacteraceae bacterium]
MRTRISEFDRLFGSMDLLRNRMNRLFADFDRLYGGDLQGMWREDYPPTNLYDFGDRLEIRAMVPGLNREDLNVKIQGNYLEINGTRKSDAPEGYEAHRVERPTATFSRSFTLPCDVDADRVEAHMKNGMLTLIMPKPEAAKPKQIAIS